MKNNLEAYVKSIYELGKETKSLSLFIGYAKSLDNLFKTDQDFLDFLSDPNIKIEKKENFLNSIFQSKKSLFFKNWLLILIEKRLIRRLDLMLLRFINLYNKENEILEGVIWTTHKLSQKEISEIKKSFEKKFKKNVFLINKIDLSLLSGIRVEIESNIWENSMKSNLDLMLDKLLNT
ncbi:MAG: hypothetical protein HPAVJP_0530 [Candidatus Hepatoplasma vulgare]|nr:MAG: hypothetical protein HPAVJP_0530 [Candidatus Hepatoplasma sp.]